jgi:dTDP-4-dehydrorhamnose reductase
MNILVTGKNGQLGSEFQDLSLTNKNFNFYFSDIDNLDITNTNQLNKYFNLNKIELIINCAAYTAVDKAEEEPNVVDLVNNIAVKNLVTICLKFNIKLIHISTDYVFDGENSKPYSESDKTNPIGLYGLSKRKGEMHILSSSVNGIIIRTSWLYSTFGNNFVKNILKLSHKRKSLNIVNDQIGTPTYAGDLASSCLEIIKKNNWDNNPELFHYSNMGMCSWYDFAKEIFKIKNPEYEIYPVNSNQFISNVKRPKFSVLCKRKIIKKYDLVIPDWKTSLKNCLKKM